MVFIINNGIKELYKILYLVSYEILGFCNKFSNDIFLMNRFTSIVMDDWNLDEIHANYLKKVLYILHPNNLVMKYFLNDWHLDEKLLSKW